MSFQRGLNTTWDGDRSTLDHYEDSCLLDMGRMCFVEPRTRLACSVLRTIFFAVLLNSLDARGLLDSRSTLDDQFHNVKNREHAANQETTRQMLNVLGMDELPKPRQGVIPHQYMIQIYEKMSRRKPDKNGVNTVRGFVDVGK